MAGAGSVNLEAPHRQQGYQILFVILSCRPRGVASSPLAHLLMVKRWWQQPYP